MNKTFCVLAWIGVTTDTSGRFKPCCVSSDIIKKNDGTFYNLGYDTLESVYNSDYYKNIRQKMLDEEPVTGCDRCYLQEKYGGISQRIRYNNFEFSNVRPKTIDTDVKIKYFDLRFGNLCNLNCRSCSPANSSQFAKEIENLSDTKMYKFHNIFKEDINTWYTTDQYKQNIETQIENMEFLYITGGEPTIIKENFDTLTKLVESGRSKKMILQINTNMTNSKKEFFNLIKEFKRVIFFASIDGFGDVQEYLRYPSTWQEIDKNFQKLLDKDITNIIIRPSPVLQITNLEKIVELFEYFENFNRQANRLAVEIAPIILENPKYLNLSYLPLDYKIECYNEIQDWLTNKCKYQNKYFRDRMGIIKGKCHEDLEYKSILDEYFEYNDILDKSRKQNLKLIAPKLYQLRRV